MIKTARESIHTIETDVISIRLRSTNQTCEDETSTEWIMQLKKRLISFNEKFSMSQKYNYREYLKIFFLPSPESSSSIHRAMIFLTAGHKPLNHSWVAPWRTWNDGQEGPQLHFSHEPLVIWFERFAKYILACKLTGSRNTKTKDIPATNQNQGLHCH